MIVLKAKERGWGPHEMNNNHETLDTGVFLIFLSFGVGCGESGQECLPCKHEGMISDVKR